MKWKMFIPKILNGIKCCSDAILPLPTFGSSLWKYLLILITVLRFNRCSIFNAPINARKKLLEIYIFFNWRSDLIERHEKDVSVLSFNLSLVNQESTLTVFKDILRFFLQHLKHV